MRPAGQTLDNPVLPNVWPFLTKQKLIGMISKKRLFAAVSRPGTRELPSSSAVFFKAF